MRRFRLRRRTASGNDGAKAPQTTAPAPPNSPRPNQVTATAKSLPHGKAKANRRVRKPRDAFSPKQRAFITYYVAEKNGVKAARLAGYGKKGAHVASFRLLNNVAIKAEIDRQLERQAQRIEISGDRIKAELAKIGFANMEHYMRPGPDGEPILDFSGLTSDQTAAMQEVTVEEFMDGRSDKRRVRRVKFKLGDKINALETLGRSLNLFTQKVDHRHEHQHTILGVLLHEIDEESRGRTIEHEPAED